jgi:hypothetical protein
MSAVTMLGQGDIRSARMANAPRRAVVWVCAIAIAATASVTIAVVMRAVAGQQGAITLATNLQQGQRITAAELRVADIGSGSVAGALPAADVSDLVGQYAMTGLTAGSVLTRAEVSAQQIPIPALARVSVRVSASSAARLTPGDEITVIANGRTGSTISAVVFAVSGRAVELLVPPDYASDQITVLP